MSEQYCQQLGEGTYGCVEKVSETLAQKTYHSDDSGYVDHQSAIIEISALKAMRNSKNCNYLDSVNIKDNLVRVRMPLGDINLNDILDRRRIEQRKMTSIIHDTLNGLVELHEQDLLHLDLKPGNLVRFKDDDGNKVWKLIDYGLAMFGTCFLEDTYINGNLITLGYRPPELYHSGIVSAKADIYSLGVIFVLLMSYSTESHLYDGFEEYKNTSELYDKILTIISTMREDINMHEDSFQYLTVSQVRLILSMSDQDPTKRPTLSQLKDEVLPGGRQIKDKLSCHKLINKRLQGPVTSISLNSLAKVKAQYNILKKARYSVYFLALHFMSVESSKGNADPSTKLALQLAADISADPYVQFQVLNSQSYIKYVETIQEFETFIFTPYTLLYNLVGHNSEPIEKLITYTQQYPELYFDPRIPPNWAPEAIADYWSDGLRDTVAINRLKDQFGMDVSTL